MRQPSHSDIKQDLDDTKLEIFDRLSAGNRRFTAIEEKLDKLLEAFGSISEIKADLAAVKKDAAETKEIVEAWAAVKTLGKGIKWLAMIAASVTALYVAFRAGVSQIVR